jgi:hypothetical protein
MSNIIRTDMFACNTMQKKNLIPSKIIYNVLLKHKKHIKRTNYFIKQLPWINVAHFSNIYNHVKFQNYDSHKSLVRHVDIVYSRKLESTRVRSMVFSPSCTNIRQVGSVRVTSVTESEQIEDTTERRCMVVTISFPLCIRSVLVFNLGPKIGYLAERFSQWSSVPPDTLWKNIVKWTTTDRFLLYSFQLYHFITLPLGKAIPVVGREGP